MAPREYSASIPMDMDVNEEAFVEELANMDIMSFSGGNCIVA